MKNEHQYSLICVLVLLLLFFYLFFFSFEFAFIWKFVLHEKKMHTYICHGLIDSHSYSIDVKPLDIREDWNKDIIWIARDAKRKRADDTYMHTAILCLCRGNRRCIRQIHPSLASGRSFDSLSILLLITKFGQLISMHAKTKTIFFSLRP